MAVTTAAAFGLPGPAFAKPPAPTPAPTQPAPTQPAPPQPATFDPPQEEPVQPEHGPTSAPGGKQAASIASAMAQAAKTDKAVAVGVLTDEYSTTVANPNGSLTTIYSSSPDRVRQNGSWVPIDTNLVRHADGTIGPKAALAGVSFGAGGDRSLVTLRNGARASSSP